MSLPRAALFPAFLMAVLTAAPSALAATVEADDTPPGIPEWIKILGDVDKPDKQRASARGDLTDEGAVKELLELWKATKDENVRMHVAIALAKVDKGRDVIGKNLDVLAEGLAAKDAALRYWTVFAIANARTAKALQLLAEALKAAVEALEAKTKPKEGADKPATKVVDRVTNEERLIVAIARALGSMGTDVLAGERAKLLFGAALLGNAAHARIRIGAIEALRVWGRKTGDIVLPLFQVAKTDPDEAVWRAAARALQTLARTQVFIQNVPPPVGCTEETRQDRLKVWERQWKIEAARRKRKPKLTG